MHQLCSGGWGCGGGVTNNKTKTDMCLHNGCMPLHCLFVSVTIVVVRPLRHNNTGTSGVWFLLRCFLLTFHLLAFPTKTPHRFSSSGGSTQPQLQCCPPMAPKCKLQLCPVGRKSAIREAPNIALMWPIYVSSVKNNPNWSLLKGSM